MGRNVLKWCISFTLLILGDRVFCEDGLQGAFNVMDRRQQDLMGYPKYEKFYSESGVSRYSVPENNLVFLGQTDVRGPSPGI